MWILPWIAVDTLGLVMLQHGVAACYEVKMKTNNNNFMHPLPSVHRGVPEKILPKQKMTVKVLCRITYNI